MRYTRLTCLALLPLWLAACSVGPDYVRPPQETPAAFKEWKAAEPAEPAQEKWWQVFADPVLDELEAQVEVNNQNLKLAEAQYRAARAGYESARSEFFPSLSLSGSRTRAGGATAATGATAASTSYSVSASASWEVDVWGRIRRDVESAGAKAEASAADLAAAKLSTQALLAQTYIQLRAADSQLDLLKRTAEADLRFLELTRNRLAAGVASPLDVAEAEAQLGSAQTSALDTENTRAQLEHALAVLVGKPPAEFSLAPEARLPALPPVPALLPSALLERRPDIAAAERRMAAANAQIGVATAAWFPTLNLTGTGGYKGAALSGLVSAPHRFWSLGPALAMTLIDGGARSAAIASASAAYDQAVATYRQTVLTAFQEVEDNLSSVRLLAQEAEAQGRALAAARRSREIAQNQYQAGVSSALNVVTAQTSELAAASNAVSIASRRLQAGVVLLKNAAGSLPAETEKAAP